MPVLRQAPDNTLAETLGGLGNSLTTAFNPLNQIKAGNLQSEIQARNWELQQKQSMDAANRNAANVFYNSDIAQTLDPATREMTAAGLRTGTLSVNSYIDALTKTGNLKANQAAAAMYATQHSDLPSAELLSDQAELLAGRKTASELDAQRATTKLTTLKTTQTQAGVDASGTPLSKEAAAIGQPETASKLDAQNQVTNTVIDPNAPDAAAQIDKLNAANLAAGYGRPPVGQALTPSLQPQADTATAARGAENERQKDVAEMIAKGIPQTGNLFPGPLPGQPGNTIGAPFNPNPTPDAAPPPNITLPNVASPSATPTPIVTHTPAGTIVGATPAQTDQTKAVDTANREELQGAVDAGVAGTKMLALLDRLTTLAHLAKTGGGAQIPTWVDGWLRDHGLVMTDRQGILAEMKAEFTAQIPELRKDMGVKFEAGPELSAQSKMIGDASLPEQVLMGIFARQATIAKMAVDKRNLAMRSLYPGQASPLSINDYHTQAAAIDDNVTNEMRQQMKDYGAYTPESVAPPPVPRQASGNSMMDAIQALLRHLGGADTQTPAPAQTGNEVWSVDAQGHPYRVK